MAFAVLPACSSFGQHFEAHYWGDALAHQTRSFDQLLLELGTLEATIGLAPFDHTLQHSATEDTPITEGSTANGDGTAVGLGVLAAGVGVRDGIDGDDAHSLEVLGESLLITESLTELLKHTVGRERPSGSSNTSFPSGHSSFSFSMATFVQRRVSDLGTGWAGDLGYLAYLPAAYVGIDRVESNHHWPSDVAFGAFLGILLTNVVYDAHYGSAEHTGIFGVKGLGIEAEPLPDGAGINLVLSF